MSGTGSFGFSGSNDVLANAATLCASYVVDCVRPFTDKRDGKFDSVISFGQTDDDAVQIEGVCCGTNSDCCEWTAGGITLLTFLILLLLFLIGGCVYCCCGIGNPRGGCCNRGPVSKKLTANLL